MSTLSLLWRFAVLSGFVSAALRLGGVTNSGKEGEKKKFNNSEVKVTKERETRPRESGADWS